jgi:hypothetical protein
VGLGQDGEHVEAFAAAQVEEDPADACDDAAGEGRHAVRLEQLLDPLGGADAVDLDLVVVGRLAFEDEAFGADHVVGALLLGPLEHGLGDGPHEGGRGLELADEDDDLLLLAVGGAFAAVDAGGRERFAVVDDGERGEAVAVDDADLFEAKHVDEVVGGDGRDESHAGETVDDLGAGQVEAAGELVDLDVAAHGGAAIN